MLPRNLAGIAISEIHAGGINPAPAFSDPFLDTLDLLGTLAHFRQLSSF